MARAFRQFLIRALPGPVRSRLRQWWLRESKGGKPLRLVVHPPITAGQVTVQIEDQAPLQLTTAVLPDLRLHCESKEHVSEMRAFIRECGVTGLLIDVGAHNGFFSLLYAAAHPANRVLAFEPSDELRSRAEHLVAINHLADRVTFSSDVVADKSGDVKFFADASSSFVQTQACAGNDMEGFSPVTLRATTLDEACRGLVPTLIKVDVEGYEWEVLQGARQTLETHRPTVFLELHLNYLEQRGIEPKRVLGLLEQCGYHFFSAEGRPLTLASIIRSWLPVARIVARPAK